MSLWLLELSCYTSSCCPVIHVWCFFGYLSFLVIEVIVFLSFMFDVSLVTWMIFLQNEMLSVIHVWCFHCYLCCFVIEVNGVLPLCLMSPWFLELSCYTSSCCPVIPVWWLLGYLSGFAIEVHVALSFMFDVSLVNWVVLL